MPGVNTAEKVTVPAPGDTFDYMGEIRRLANSQRTVVSVANRAEGDVVAAAMTADSRPPTDANPLVCWNVALKRIEVKVSGGWLDAGRINRHVELSSLGFTVAGGNASWDVGPLTRVAVDSENDAGMVDMVGATSGAFFIRETGYYCISSVTMPTGGTMGNAMVTYNRNGNTVLSTYSTTGYAWEVCGSLPRIRFSAGDYVRLTMTANTSRVCDTRVRITKLV